MRLEKATKNQLRSKIQLRGQRPGPSFLPGSVESELIPASEPTPKVLAVHWQLQDLRVKEPSVPDVREVLAVRKEWL